MQPWSSAPTLETARLILRAHRPDDLAACEAMRADAAVMRFIGDGRPESRETVWSRLLRAAGHWPFAGYGMWCVTEKVSGRYVGDVGFMQLKRDMVPPLGEVPEIGWVLAVGHRARGLRARRSPHH
ncbi:GNAT family N-acetyltransferase [Hyphomicrobiales bacterium BP6-180914]|uniref:GNAT family N-acetyltransferase n=1 Tax=Lichenifustis flavocetrariae TaxID=2949735 RepID=A0AA42CLV2_9HYPH|nr:GNAT family protein [Lichenifustis flavocetrariae]MCW6507700.1 GNAT family N-acetyltransferase [Lichenifustis flavocetrariae]